MILSTSATVQPGGRLSVLVAAAFVPPPQPASATSGERERRAPSAARVGPGGALPSTGAGSAAASSAAPSSRSRTLNAICVQLVAPQHLAHDQCAGDDHRRCARVEAAGSSALRERQRLRAASSRSTVARRSVVGAGEERQLGRRCRRRRSPRSTSSSGSSSGTAAAGRELARSAGRRAGTARSAAPSRCRGSCGSRR